ncbi:MAG: helix-turn-helix transcriptional regulator [Clostridia bacterium]|nr:helix-turn-helix transcriptional regulator [Clostridia bacterium]
MQNTSNEFDNLIYNLCKLRKEHTLPKYKMAKVLGIGISTWNKIESGYMPERLGVESIFRACDFFGIKPKDLLANKL